MDNEDKNDDDCEDDNYDVNDIEPSSGRTLGWGWLQRLWWSPFIKSQKFNSKSNETSIDDKITEG